MDVGRCSEQITMTLHTKRNAADGSECFGYYKLTCRDKEGNVKWEDHVPNVVTYLGKREIADKAWGAVGYTANMYMGIISSVGYSSAPVAGDLLASHSGWTEAGGTNAPTYVGDRHLLTWNAATGTTTVSKSCVPVTFTFSGTGVIKGLLIVSGNPTKDDTSYGILMTAGLNIGGDRPVDASDTIAVNYTWNLN